MRILFVSNYFPPEARGGYELWCQETALRLARSRHSVAVLTSRSSRTVFEAQNGAVEVFRKLRLQVTGDLKSTLLRFALRARLERENLVAVEETLSTFKPDVALAWGLWNVPRSVPHELERRLPGRMAYYLSDYWPALPPAFVQQLNAPARRPLLQFPKRLAALPVNTWMNRAGSAPLRFEHPICVTSAVRRSLVEAGIPIDHAQIVYGGTDLDEFGSRSIPRRPDGRPLQAVFLGRLTSDKGVHTAIEAMAHLLRDAPETAELDIYGQGDAEYEAMLRSLIRRHALEQHVRLRGSVSRRDLPAVLSRYEILIFPSEWEEPFGRVITEAMAAGLCVVGTCTGGAAEILVGEENGLTFPVGDARALSTQLHRLAGNDTLRRRLAEAGRRQVRERFSLDRMVGEIESFLARLARGPCEPALAV